MMTPEPTTLEILPVSCSSPCSSSQIHLKSDHTSDHGACFFAACSSLTAVSLSHMTDNQAGSTLFPASLMLTHDVSTTKHYTHACLFPQLHPPARDTEKGAAVNEAAVLFREQYTDMHCATDRKIGTFLSFLTVYIHSVQA